MTEHQLKMILLGAVCFFGAQVTIWLSYGFYLYCIGEVVMRRVPSCIPDNLLPADMSGFVAGGYAACPELASDIDLWVNESKPGTLEERRARILDHLKQSGFWDYVEEYSNRVEGVDGDGYDNLPVTTMKVAKVVRQGQLPIHIMVTDAPIVAVLKAFDISTHQVAINYYADEKVIGPDWTPLEAMPVAFRINEHTVARLDKITKRYAHLRKAA